VQGDGIGFKTDEAKAMMRIPLAAEAQHFEIIGDTGTGKDDAHHADAPSDSSAA